MIFYKIDVLKESSKFTEKYLCCSHFSIKLQASRLGTSLKRDSSTVVFSCEICAISLKHYLQSKSRWLLLLIPPFQPRFYLLSLITVFWLHCFFRLGTQCHFFCRSVCSLCTISQELYIMWSWFLVNMCKMTISPSIFFSFFKVLLFWAVMGIKGQKIAQNEK